MANSNILIVEGATEKRLIPELIEHRGHTWVNPSTKSYAVEIKDLKGIDNILAPNTLETFLKSPELKSLGIIFDRDGSDGVPDRWNAMKNRCLLLGATVPETLPTNGHFETLPSGIKFGIWMMPDNSSQGMLETFLTHLVPNTSTPLYRHSQESTDRAKQIGAPFLPQQHDKALIHSWLAWQNPPGQQLHDAVKFKTLDPNSTYADNFVNWFTRLFNLS